MLLGLLFKSLIKVGTLRVVDANGKVHVFSGVAGPAVTLRLGDPRLHRSLYFNPNLSIGEAFVDGSLSVEDGDIYDFMALCMMNMDMGHDHWLQELIAAGRRLARRFAQHNPVARAQTHVAHHYDLSGTLYELFLDKDRQYSCAYFEGPSDSLERAQDNKKRHIAAKLLLEPGIRVLDIGSGWGGLALWMGRSRALDGAVSRSTWRKSQAPM